MVKDFFSSNAGNAAITIGILIAIAAGMFLPIELAGIVFTLFFFFIGGLCLWNYRNCKRVHCQITGVGFTLVGIIALLNVLSIISINWIYIWGIYFLVLIIGYGYEYYYCKKNGSCYKQ